MKIFEVKGTEYQMGYTIGENFKSFLTDVMPEFEKLVPDYIDRIKLLEGKLKHSLPGCLDELYGRADGAGVSRDAMLLYMFPEICGRTDGCTSLIVKKDDGILFAHNEDDRDFNTENVALVKYCYEDGFVFAYTMACRMAGSAYAYNESGLVFSSNYIFGGDLMLDNVSRYIILRDVINSKSIEEVERKLRCFEAASPFSLNVVDINSNTAINFEKDVCELYITPIDEKYARSNHIVSHEACLDRVPTNSIFRCTKSRELIAKLEPSTCTLEDLLAILAYEGDSMDTSVYQNPDKYPHKIVTVSTFGVDTAKREFLVYDFISKCVYVFDKCANLIATKPLN